MPVKPRARRAGAPDFRKIGAGFQIGDAAALARLIERERARREFVQRCFDLALTIPMLILAAPIIGLAAVLVRLESPGPAIFVQLRVGKDRALFRLFKLRTMAVDGGPFVTAADDSRITRIGRLLRRTRIDELPQLWNVLRGDMSVIGPRPEHPRFVAHYPREWQPLLNVRPGLTDPATVAFTGEEALLRHLSTPEAAYIDVVMPAKAELSLEGLQSASIISDIRILLRSVSAVLQPHRSPHPAVEEAQRQLDAFDRRPLT